MSGRMEDEQTPVPPAYSVNAVLANSSILMAGAQLPMVGRRQERKSLLESNKRDGEHRKAYNLHFPLPSIPLKKLFFVRLCKDRALGGIQ